MDTTQWTWGTLSDPIFEHALTRPDAAALVHRDARLSYARLAARIGQTCVHLHGLGVRPGEVVGVGLGFGIDAVVFTLALLRLGAVPVDVAGVRPNSLTMPIERFAIRRLLAPAPLALPEGVMCHVVDAALHTTLAHLGGDRRTARDPAAVHLLHIAPDRHGGTKAIMLNQHQLLARMHAATRLFPEAFPATAPPMLLLSGGMGFAVITLMVAQFAAGGPVGLLPPDPDAARLARLIAGAGEAVCMVPATLCRRFLAVAPSDGMLFPNLRGLIHGTGVLTDDEQASVSARLARAVWPVHGTAETGFIARALPGPVAPGLWVEATDGAGQPVPPGTVGHLRYRGPGVALGLHRAPPEELAPEGFGGGWFRSGEIGSIALDGTLRLTGTAADLIRRRGIDISIPALEAELRGHHGVHDAVVIAFAVPGTPDPVLVGFAVAAGTPDPEGLARHCASRLAPPLRPDRLAFISEIPRLADGRADRRRLAALASRQEKPATPA